MNQAELVKKLQSILNKADMDKDSPITRGKSNKHSSRTEVLLEHISILVAGLRHDAEASRRELKEAKDILEFGENDFSG